MASPSVIADGFTFLESPHWRDGRLWLADMYGGQVVSMTADGGDRRIEAELDDNVGGFGWTPDGDLLVIAMTTRKILRRQDDHNVVHADLSSHASSTLNDMLVSADGHAYVGQFGFDLAAGAPVQGAPLLRVDPHGEVSVVDSDLVMANGLAQLAGTLVVAESLGNRISSFDIAPNGALGRQETWVAFGDKPSSTDLGEVFGSLAMVPDGICSDGDGALWVADSFGQRVVKVTRDGIVDQIELGTGVFACELGGGDGRTLFLCTAPGFEEQARRDARDSVLLAVQLDARRTSVRA